MIGPDQIAVLKVYPPIGVARVGNAAGPDEFVIGTETIGGAATIADGRGERPALYVEDFRNGLGEIKRQAARFRVYAHMKDGAVHEITSDVATIEWRVTVANLKAGWYEFQQAMDLGPLSETVPQRNLELASTPKARKRLDITPTPLAISGPNAGPLAFDDGVFWNKNVYLGELRTDPAGRLIFLGGTGAAASFRSDLAPLTFANNTGWHDDLCDGPVRASVTFAGHKTLEAEPGYVTVTPPNYAPGLVGVVTMDDAVREVFYDLAWLPRPESTSFATDVLPIFERLSGLQWVNHGLFVLHGFGSSLDAADPAVLARLNDPSPANAEWRGAVFDLFRNPNAQGGQDTFNPQKIPQIYGDGADTILPLEGNKRFADGELAVTRTQYEHLERWAAGRFTPSATPGEPVAPAAFLSLTTAEQVRHLERAGLHDCLGGPFHPAMEMTWVMRTQLLWRAPYRLKVLEGDRPAQQDFGPRLTPAVCLGAGGPYDGAAAGCLTRFLGVPWQTDHTSCNSAQDYSPNEFLSMPTFWGPRAPDQVLAEGDFLRAVALSGAGAATERQMFKHLMNRVDWLRDIRGNDYFDRLIHMINEWHELGMVLPVKGQPDALNPPSLRVEQGRVVGKEPYEVVREAKYQLTKSIEDLFAPSGAPRADGPTPAAVPKTKRSFRQGTI